MATTLLVLGINFSLDYTEVDRENARVPPRTLSTITAWDAQIVPVLLVETPEDLPANPWRSWARGKLLIKLPNRGDSTARGRRIAETLHSLMVLLGGLPLALLNRMGGQEAFATEVPARIVRRRQILLEELVALEDGYDALDPTEQELIRNLLKGGTTLSERSMAEIFFHLSKVATCDDLFDASEFYRQCATDYTFLGDEITNVLNQPQLAPESQRDRILLENTVLHAFRAIEAVVGEPGADRRFRARLVDHGIDPDELVGFPGEQRARIGDQIRWLQDLRDATSAHGRRRRRQPVRYREAMEAQHLARVVLLRAVRHGTSVDGRSDGTRLERQYLLDHMFGRQSVRAMSQRFGVSAAELVARPGGFGRLLAEHERG